MAGEGNDEVGGLTAEELAPRLTLVCLVGLLAAEKRNSVFLRTLFKPLASAGFVWLGKISTHFFFFNPI